MIYNTNITVVGSINMDLISTSSRFPKKGETILGVDFSTNPGGKGANQAIAAARFGSSVNMIGCVGKDAFGEEMKVNLEKNGVNTSNIYELENISSGIANITLAERDNHIIVIPAANSSLTPEIIVQNENVISESDILLLQLEIPLETVEKSIQIAKKYGTKVILNPAPITRLPIRLLKQVDFLTPNEHELAEFISNENQKEFYEKYPERFIVTRGKVGVEILDNGKKSKIRGHEVNVIDTTGAGDTFNGVFASMIGKGSSVPQACQYANAAAAISVQVKGAQKGMPTFDDVLDMLSEKA